MREVNEIGSAPKPMSVTTCFVPSTTSILTNDQ